MTVYTGTQNDSGIDTANQLLVDLIATNLVTEGWVVEESSAVSGQDRSYILSSNGESTTDDLYIGLRTYQSVSSDYYNISFSYFTGYVNGNNFEDQPGFLEKSVCAHNLQLFYWMFVNKDYIRIGLDIDSGTAYELAFLGKFRPFATPTQYPLPLAVFGSLDAQEPVRFSEDHDWGFMGEMSNKNASAIRLLDGSNFEPQIWPFEEEKIAGSKTPGNSAPGNLHDLRDTNNSYPMLPLIIMGSNDVYGIIPGINYISGFNNSAANTLIDNSIDFVVLRNTTKTGFADYLALELD